MFLKDHVTLKSGLMSAENLKLRFSIKGINRKQLLLIVILHNIFILYF